jgi:hypothetical protein
MTVSKLANVFLWSGLTFIVGLAPALGKAGARDFVTELVFGVGVFLMVVGTCALWYGLISGKD